MVHFCLSALLIIYTTVIAKFSSMTCLLFIQLFQRIFAQCPPYYLYNYYSAFLLPALLIIYTTVIVHYCSVPFLLFIQLL